MSDDPKRVRFLEPGQSGYRYVQGPPPAPPDMRRVQVHCAYCGEERECQLPAGLIGSRSITSISIELYCEKCGQVRLHSRIG